MNYLPGTTLRDSCLAGTKRACSTSGGGLSVSHHTAMMVPGSLKEHISVISFEVLAAAFVSSCLAPSSLRTGDIINFGGRLMWI